MKVGMCEGGPTSLLSRFAEELRRAGALLLLSLGRLAEPWRIIRMCPYYAPKPLRGGASKGADAWIAHAKDAKVGKGDWLLEIRIGNRAYNTGRVAGGDRVGGDIFGDDGTSADDDTVTQGYTFENDGARTDKAAATDFYRF